MFSKGKYHDGHFSHVRGGKYGRGKPSKKFTKPGIMEKWENYAMKILGISRKG
jgi:hypothetical protein